MSQNLNIQKASAVFCEEDVILFNQVYQSSRAMVYEYALLLTQCSAHAEDIVQDVFICIWTERDKIPFIGNLKAYLYTITRNKVIDHMRRSQKEQCILKELSWAKENENIFTEDLLQQKEYKKIIDLAIAKLPPRQKLVFSLGKLYKWKRQEIAATMGISPATVRVHMNEAIKSIKFQVNQNSGWEQELSELINYKHL